MIVFFRRHPWLAVLLFTWGAWFSALWPQLFQVQSDGIWSGHPFIWADWSVHLTYLSRFLYTPPIQWFSQHPIYALERWTYPPVPNLISAILFRFSSLEVAMLLPVVLGTAALLLFLFLWFREHQLSERASFLGVSLFLLSGSWGWPLWLQAVGRAADWGEVLYPSRLYTQVFEHHLVWLNPVAGMVLPQRAFVMGFPLLLWILIRLRRICFDRTESDSWVTAALLATASGILFLTHTHSFLALAVLCSVWFVFFWQRLRFWLRYGLLTAALVFPWYWFVLRGSSAVMAFSLDPGWMSAEPFGLLSWFWFWLKNWGIFLPLTVVGFWQSQSSERRWQVGFWVLFFFANLVRAQSYDWDNAKLLIVVLVGFLPVVIRVLQQLRRRAPKILGTIAVVLIVLFSCWSGVLELVRISQPSETRWRMAGPQDVAYAEAVRAIVPTDEVVLTSDQNNHPVPMLSGRPVLLGYVGWVWSYGFKYNQVERDVRLMYTDTVHSTALRNFYGIRWVSVGPSERASFGTDLVPSWLCSPEVSIGEHTLYRCDE